MPGLVLHGERRGLRDLVYGSIRDAIVSLEIAPGERITEEGLCGQLGVSRPVLREALQLLQVDQLVDRLDNGRMRVRPITAEDVEHLYAVRSALEQLVVREAAARLSDEHRELLSAELAGMRRAEEAGDQHALAASGTRFHQLLATVAGNPVNDRLMRQIQGPIDRLRQLSVTVSTRARHSVAEHAAVLDALVSGRVDAAADAMHRHIMSGRRAVLLAVAERTATG